MIAAPADKRFRRAHVKPGRRTKARVRLVLRTLRALVVAAVVAYGAWRGAWFVLGSPALHITHISVRGNERLSTGEVLARVDGLEGKHILAVRLDEWRRRVLSSPWVQEVTLRRMLPGAVEISVRERKPMAIGRIQNRLYLVDASGAVIDEYGPQHADIDLPIVDGLTFTSKGEKSKVDEHRAQLAGRLLSALASRPDVGRRVSQVDVSDRRNAVVILEGDNALLRIGDRDFVERIQSYIDLAPALRERVVDIDYVDLRFDERLYVRPASSVTHGRN